MAVQAISTVAAASKSINQLNCRGTDSFLWTKNPLELKNLQCKWLGTPIKFSLQSKNFKQFLSKQCTIRANVSFVLPRGKSEPTVPIEKIPKWSAKAVKSFTMAELEARKLKYDTTGTEALILGMLIEGTNFASKYLMANSITLLKFREEAIKILGKGDLFHCSPKEPPLTEDAQKALDWAFDEKLKSRSTSMKVLAEANLKFKCLLDCTGLRSITVSLSQICYTTNLSMHGRGLCHVWSCVASVQLNSDVNFLSLYGSYLLMLRLTWFKSRTELFQTTIKLK